MRKATIAAAAAALSAASPSYSHQPAGQQPTVPALAPEAVEAAAAVDRFHAALRQGDETATLALLADDALVFEAGGAERSKAEYAAEHLGADIAFSQAVAPRLTRRLGGAAGDFAWVAS